MSDLVRPTPGTALRILVSWFLDQVADALAVRLRARADGDRDVEWGMVWRETLPSWIHPDDFIEACRRGRIDGARIHKRKWIAARAAVEAWWLAESRLPTPANVGVADDLEDLDAIVAANGFERRTTR